MSSNNNELNQTSKYSSTILKYKIAHKLTGTFKRYLNKTSSKVSPNKLFSNDYLERPGYESERHAGHVIKDPIDFKETSNLRRVCT